MREEGNHKGCPYPRWWCLPTQVGSHKSCPNIRSSYPRSSVGATLVVARTDNERTTITPANRKGAPIHRANVFVTGERAHKMCPCPRWSYLPTEEGIHKGGANASGKRVRHRRGQPQGVPLREAEAGCKPGLPEVVGGGPRFLQSVGLAVSADSAMRCFRLSATSTQPAGPQGGGKILAIWRQS